MRAVGELLDTQNLPPLTDIKREYLLRLPSTPVLEQQLAEAERDHRYLAKERERAIRFAEFRLTWGRARDSAQANRPDGCWCLGLGGKTPRYIRGDSDAYVFDEYCDCPDGQRIRTLHRQGKSTLVEQIEAERRQRLWEIAGVPPKYEDCTLETFPATVKSQAAVHQVRRWVVNKPRPTLLIWGPFGTGKTGLAAGALRVLVLGQGQDALFVTAPDFLADLRKVMDGQVPGVNAETVLQAVRTTNVLLLDDLGSERLSEWGEEQLFKLLNHRKNHRLLTILTTNLGWLDSKAREKQQLAEHLGERVAWRVLDFGNAQAPPEIEIVDLDGPNLRAGGKAA